MLNARELIGTHDVLFVTLDTLRYDVATSMLEEGRTPNLAALLPWGGWEMRHTPGTFTFPAHQAFFAGFLPTPVAPGPHPRLFAARFRGSETITFRTYVFDAPDIVTGLGGLGYHTVCIGGVDFFDKQSPLGTVLPGLFAESHWNLSFASSEPHSTENQVRLACEIIAHTPRERRLFLFINISAMHHPTWFYLPGAQQDSLASHAAALAYVDQHLPPLFEAQQRHGPSLVILCSDHGTAFGEGGYWGHRISHPVVLTVPYAEFVLPEKRG